MNEEIRQTQTENRDYIDQQEKLWIRIQRAIQNNEKEFFYNYKGIGEIKVTLKDS